MTMDSSSSSPPARAVVVGVGFIGGPVVDRLATRGTEVLALSRSGGPGNASKHPRVRTAAFDLLRDDPRERLEPAELWVLCYASGGRQDRRRLYVDGARAIAQAAALHRPGRVVYTSSTSALPAREGRVDEDASGPPAGERGAIQREAELALQAGLDAAALPLTILRLAGLYGPGRELGRLYLRDPGGLLPGDGHEATNLVHRDDAVEAVWLAALRDPPLPGIVHICDDDHRSRREMIETLAARAGLPAPRWAEPAPLDAAPRGKRVANERMKRELGLRLRHPRHDP